MCKNIYIFMILLTGTQIQAQSNISQLSRYHKNKQNNARNIKLKTVTAYEYHNEKDRKGKLVLEEFYDNSGNIANRTAINGKYINKYIYFYDRFGRIQKITEFHSYLKNWVFETHLIYDSTNQITVIYGGGLPNSIVYDTIQYFYDAAGRVIYENQRRYNLTIKIYEPWKKQYYHYNKYGDEIKISNDTSAPQFEYENRDSNYCSTIVKTAPGQRVSYKNDSLCRTISEQEEVLLCNQWMVIKKTAFSEIPFYCVKDEKVYKINGKKCKYKSRLTRHTHYDYLPNGLCIQETTRNAKGKVLFIKRYAYTYYTL